MTSAKQRFIADVKSGKYPEYKNTTPDYAWRKERGKRDGLTLSQARGHAKASELPASVVRTGKFAAKPKRTRRKFTKAANSIHTEVEYGPDDVHKIERSLKDKRNHNKLAMIKIEREDGQRTATRLRINDSNKNREMLLDELEENMLKYGKDVTKIILTYVKKLSKDD